MPAPRLERHDLRHRDGRRLFLYGQLRGTLEEGPRGPESRAGPVGGAGSGLHQRYDRLTGAWIAVSPARNVRPHDRHLPAGCPLCPGGPEIPFGYEAAVFENRFPSLVEDPVPVADDPRLKPSQGRCEVVLYTERHEGSLATLTATELARLLAIWRDRSAALWSDARHRFVMVFENRGAAVGATIAHPHGQIYAFDHLPQLIAARSEVLAEHRAATGRCLSCDVVAEDLAAAERTLAANEALVSAVPFAPHWPFEVHVRARRHGARRLADLRARELPMLSAVLREVVLRYDGLFGFELPYMMVVLEAPADAPDWHLAFEFLPPHRSARLTKIRASVETATGLFINDTEPETSAARLKGVPVAAHEEAPVPDVVSPAARSDQKRSVDPGGP